jgi:hypothetical protein
MAWQMSASGATDCTEARPADSDTAILAAGSTLRAALSIILADPGSIMPIMAIVFHAGPFMRSRPHSRPRPTARAGRSAPHGVDVAF